MILFASNCWYSTTIRSLLDISALPKLPNFSHEITTSPACCPTSNLMSLPAIYVLVERPLVTPNTENFPHYLCPPVPGNPFLAILLSICHSPGPPMARLSILFSFLWIVLRKWLTSFLVSNPPTPPYSLTYSSRMSFAYMVFPNPLFLIVDRFSPPISGNRCQLS